MRGRQENYYEPLTTEERAMLHNTIVWMKRLEGSLKARGHCGSNIKLFVSVALNDWKAVHKVVHKGPLAVVEEEDDSELPWEVDDHK